MPPSGNHHPTPTQPNTQPTTTHPTTPGIPFASSGHSPFRNQPANTRYCCVLSCCLPYGPAPQPSRQPTVLLWAVMRPAPKGTLPAPIGLFHSPNSRLTPSPTQAAPSTPTRAQTPTSPPRSARASLLNTRAPRLPTSPRPRRRPPEQPAVSSSGVLQAPLRRGCADGASLGGRRT